MTAWTTYISASGSRAHTGAELVNEHATFTWNELMTGDVDAATRFYTLNSNA